MEAPMSTPKNESVRLILSQEEDEKYKETTFSDAQKKIGQLCKDEKGSKLLQYVAAVAGNLFNIY